MVWQVILLVVLFFLSGFFSGSETAFMAASRVKVKDQVNKGDEKAALVDKLLEDEIRLLSTILIGNNLVNIAASAIATSIAIEIFGRSGVGIATGVMTFLILIFGEITPKSLGNNRSLKYARTVAPFLIWVERLFSPFVSFFSWLIKIIIGAENVMSAAFLTEEEIRRFVNVGEKEGAIKETESEMIHSIFDFDDIMVREIMVPRTEMVCVERGAPVNKIVELAVEYGYSRIPVYEGTVDDIVGLVYVKDLLVMLLEESPPELEDLNLEEFIKPIYFIPESKPINQLLNEMRRRQEHMAIVLDEYGGTSGLITIEDLLEEIVGDIRDEFDPEEKEIEPVGEHELIVQGGVDIDKINEYLPEPLGDEETYETISGYILHQLGYFPRESEKIVRGSLELEVIATTEHRIKKVRIKTEDPLEKLTYI